MSDEYHFTTAVPLNLDLLVAPMAQFGLFPSAASANFAAFSYESLTPDQLTRWGGNAVFELLDERRGTLTLNGVGRRTQVLTQLAELLRAQGCAVEFEER